MGELSLKEGVQIKISYNGENIEMILLIALFQIIDTMSACM